MKEKLVRWKFYFDKDKEEQWLNEMAAKGWSMKSFFAGRYTFEQTQQGEYLYQVELLPRNVKEKSEYLHFLEHEMGVELVQEWGFWIFLRKKSSEGAFELYTDAASKAEHYRKISHLFFAVAGLEFLVGLSEMLVWTTQEKLEFLILAVILYTLGLVLLRQGIRFQKKQKELER